MNLISIIITAEYKERFITSCIESCLKQNFENYEIIICYTKLKNENVIKKRFRKKNIKFLKIKKKLKNKTKDQFKKIYEGFKISKGNIISLLDGDDIFTKKKLSKVFLQKNLKNKLLVDRYFNDSENNKTIVNKNYYKNSFLYKVLINNWPKNIATSTISAGRIFFYKFFKNVNINNYEYLAIDVLLVLFALKSNQLLIKNEFLTKKVKTEHSVDLKFKGIMNKFFWKRRLEQHYFYKSLFKKKNYISVDFLICRIVNIFV